MYEKSEAPPGNDPVEERIETENALGPGGLMILFGIP